MYSESDNECSYVMLVDLGMEIVSVEEKVMLCEIESSREIVSEIDFNFVFVCVYVVVSEIDFSSEMVAELKSENDKDIVNFVAVCV